MSPAKLCPCCGRRTSNPSGYCDRRESELADQAAEHKATDWKARIRNSGRWKRVVAFCSARDGGQCTYGLEPGERFWTGRCPVKVGLTGHHIVPLEQGGDPYDPDNVRTCCDQHNKQLDAEARRAQAQA